MKKQRRQKLDIEPIIISKEAFLDFLNTELSDDFSLVIYELNKIIGDKRNHIGTNVNVTLFLKEYVHKLVQNVDLVECRITDLTKMDKWEQVREWLNE